MAKKVIQPREHETAGDKNEKLATPTQPERRSAPGFARDRRRKEKKITTKSAKRRRLANK